MALTKIPGHLLDKSAHIDFADNEQLRIGNDQDLLIHHDGTNNLIQGSANKVLYIQGRAGVNSILAVPDGAVNIYHNNSLKLETTAAGVSVTGNVVADGINLTNADNKSILLGASDDMRIRHTGSHSEITDEGQGSLRLGGNNVVIGSATFGVTMANFAQGGAVTLYHNNVPKLTTDAAGINVTGGIDVADVTATGNVSLNSDGGTLYLGAGADLRIFHDGNNSFINNTTATAGALSIKSDDINLMSTASHLMGKFEEGGPVRLYHNNAQKLLTLSTGVQVTGDLEVSGNLNITGDINSTSVTNLDVVDKTITVANNAGSSSAADGAGLIVDTGGTLPSLLWDHSNSAFQFSKAVRVVNTVRIVGGDTSGSSYGLIVKNSSNANTLLVRNDGVVMVPTNYLNVTSSGGIYSTGSIKARGGIHNDQGDLTLNDTVQVAGPVVIQGSGSQERYLAFTLDGKSSAFSGSNNCFIYNGQGSSGDFLAGALYLQSRSNTVNREIGFITGTSPAKRMVITGTGRVGVGHTDPNAQLHISAGTNSAVTIGDATNPALQIGATTNYRFGVYTDGETAYIENKNGDNGLVFRVKTAGEAMRIAGGTGTIFLGSNKYGYFRGGVENSFSSGWNANSDTYSTWINFEGYQGGTTKFRDLSIGNGKQVAIVKFDGSSGNVGIGELNPDAPLHITSNTPIIAYDESDTSQEFRLGVFGGAFALYDSNDTAFRMLVDGDGRVGIGTSAPTGQRLCIGGHSTSDTMTEANAWFVAEATGGDGIAMGSIASSPYTTWIQSGYLNTMGTSNHYPISLNPHNGLVLINTSTNAGLSNNVGGARYGHSFGGGQQVNSTNNDTNLILNMSNGYSNALVLFRYNGSTKGTISTNGSAVAYNTSSDYRLKQNEIAVWDGTTILKQLTPYKFNWKADPTGEAVQGFFAHEVAEVVPAAVHGEKDGEKMQGIDHSKLVPLLVKTIQELEARITELESK